VINGAQDVAISPDGSTLYVASWLRHVIVRVQMSSAQCFVVLGTEGSFDAGSYGEGVGTSAGLVNPSGLALSPDGSTLCFNDYDYQTTGSNARVRKVNLATCTTSVLSGLGTHGTVDGAATRAQFQTPGSMVLDSFSGGLWLFLTQSSTGHIRLVKTTTGYADIVFRYSSSSTMSG
jgi:sugar lactone lactonase YvrE